MNNKLNPAILSLTLFAVVVSPKLCAQNTAEPGQGSAQAGGQQQHQQHRRGPKQFMLANSEGAVIRVWKPDLTTLPLEVKHGSITLPRTGVDNYHALVVEKDWGYLKEALIRYEYMFGRPSGHSTSELTAAEKTEFEIVPDPVPREHQHYLSDQTWNFILRFKSTPAAGIPITLATSNGSRVEATSDSEGKVSLRIPDDFPDIQKGKRDERTAEFEVSAELTDAGVIYQTLLSAEYEVNPGHWQSFGLGVTITGIGMLAGLFIGRIGRTETGRKTR